MKMKINTNATNQITRSQMTMTCNTIRSLGLSFGLTGTRLINKVIQILIVIVMNTIVDHIIQELVAHHSFVKLIN